ncbi:MAG TPA: family 1 glycosylhydrolase [Gemmatirosa sp.]
MTRNFLDVLARTPGAPDGWNEYAKPRDSRRGRPALAPDGDAGRFLFATGIECSYPTAMGRDGRVVRRDQLAECRHYECWRDDFALVRDLGLRVLRYGLPYYRVHVGPDRYDWSFADEAMAELRRVGLTPILDLLHFGVPDWLGDFQNPELPYHFARYADAVAARYPWVRYYTPVNEVYVAARASARDGVWNERLTTDRGFVTAITHLAAAGKLAAAAIARRRPDAVFVQSESTEITHDLHGVPDPTTDFNNEVRFLSLDLLYAHQPRGDVALYLLDNGVTREAYTWFMRGEPPGYHVMGNDYYGRNEWLLLPDGSRQQAEDIAGWYGVSKLYQKRYRKPMMHTETNVFDADAAPTWLWKQWLNVLRIRSDGYPVVGFTWYSLTDQVDWDTSLAEQNGRVNACGLYDLDRRPHPVAAAYRMLLEEFGHLSTLGGTDLFQLADGPARGR